MSEPWKLAPIPPTPISPQDRINRALAILRQRGVLDDRCPRCKTSNWNIDLIEVPATSALSMPSSNWVPFFEYTNPVVNRQPTGVLPMLSLVCKNCGNTIFHNLNVLGI
jgi:hypothetical protein